MKFDVGRRLVNGLDNYVLLFFVIPVVFIASYLARLLWTSFKKARRLTSNSVLTLANTREAEAGECPICMDGYSFAVATSCGHLFCARCFCLHWKRTFYSRQISCPMCRSHVQSLQKRFTEDENARTDAAKLAIVADLDLFNRWYSGQSIPLWQRLRDLPHLFSASIQLLLTGEATPMLLRSRLVLLSLCVILYIISPLDVIPEMVTGLFGLLDDLLVFFLFGAHLYAIYRATVARPGA